MVFPLCGICNEFSDYNSLKICHNLDKNRSIFYCLDDFFLVFSYLGAGWRSSRTTGESKCRVFRRCGPWCGLLNSIVLKILYYNLYMNNVNIYYYHFLNQFLVYCNVLYYCYYCYYYYNFRNLSHFLVFT